MSDIADSEPLPGNLAREEIALLEERIAALSDSIERCRKISVAARIIMVVGAVWFGLPILGLIPFAPIHVVGAISAILGGIVLFGSNTSTRRRTESALAAAETMRAGLIDELVLQPVTTDPGDHPGSDR